MLGKGHTLPIFPKKTWKGWDKAMTNNNKVKLYISRFTKPILEILPLIRTRLYKINISETLSIYILLWQADWSRVKVYYGDYHLAFSSRCFRKYSKDLVTRDLTRKSFMR